MVDLAVVAVMSAVAAAIRVEIVVVFSLLRLPEAEEEED